MDNSYKDVEDNSVYVKFKIKNTKNEYFVVWTTTPWTLIGNVALAIDKKAEYVLLTYQSEKVWVAGNLVNKIFGENKVNVLKQTKGSSLVGLNYEPLYTYMQLEGKKAHYVAEGSFVSLEDGTGIVHTAAIFGEDDYKLAQSLDLPCVPTLDDQGKFLNFVTPLSGVFYKKAEQWIIQDLTDRGLMLRSEKTVHSYPFCYRCETPLYYNAVPAWFVDVQKMKTKMVTCNLPINWYPAHLKYGRFGKGLDTAPDWNISRSRYWGTPMPVWRSKVASDSPSETLTRIIGSIAELKKWAVNPSMVDNITDLHREFIDDLEVWVDDAKTIKGKRLPEVFDCWVESGSMPYAAIHYPFENAKIFNTTHPAQFITEYIAQTRAWFYTLHVMSVGLFGSHTFENALTTGTILAEDGSKMSKSKKNYPDPSILFEKYGVDSLRFYLMGSVVMKGENLNFSEKGVAEVYQRVVNLIWNTFSFYKLYGDHVQPNLPELLHHDLDRWIVSRTNRLIRDVTDDMDKYDTVLMCRHIANFVDELSTWYLRRSRERFKSESKSIAVFGWVLYQLTLVMAPITPFVSELMYQNLPHDQDSVHLDKWPLYNENLILEPLEKAVDLSRAVVEAIHAMRKDSNIPLKQPLLRWAYESTSQKDMFAKFPGIYKSIQEECNVKSSITPHHLSEIKNDTSVLSRLCHHKEFGEIKVYLDTQITIELENERTARELLRTVQQMRKDKKVGIHDHITLVLTNEWKSFNKDLLAKIQQDTLASSIVWGDKLEILTG